MSEAPKGHLKRLLIASDHRGYSLKETIKESLKDLPWNDLGPSSADRVDYPKYAQKMANEWQEGDYGILICGSGQGVAMAANRHPFLRAALCCNSEMVQMARQHNNANILCIGADFVKEEDALNWLKIFLDTPFEGGRHLERIQQFSETPST